MFKAHWLLTSKWHELPQVRSQPMHPPATVSRVVIICPTANAVQLPDLALHVICVCTELC